MENPSAKLDTEALKAIDDAFPGVLAAADEYALPRPPECPVSMMCFSPSLATPQLDLTRMFDNFSKTTSCWTRMQ